VQAQAMDKVLQGSNAELHQVVSSVPGGVEVAIPYRKSVNLHRLNQKELAYWNPHTSKYIIDGEYAYLWCVVYKKNRMKPKHHWVAITTAAMNRALAVGHQFPGGIAFYQLSSNKKQIFLKAYPYTTVHSMTQGAPVMDIKE